MPDAAVIESAHRMVRRIATIARLVGALSVVAVFLASCIRQGMTPDERQIFLPASALAEYGAALPEGMAKYESYAKRLYYDSTFELQYEFTPSEDAESDIRYMAETFSYENRASGILVTELVNRAVSTGIYKASGISLVERKDSFQWGDKSAAYDIVAKNGRVVGNRFVASVGRMLFDFTLVGMHIEEKETWAELLEQRLNRAKEFTIGFYSLKSSKPRAAP